MSDAIFEELIRGWSDELRVKFPRERLTHHQRTGSTNDDLLARIRGGTAKPFDLIVADFQDRGRGRRGDRWEAQAGDNLLFSLALPLPEKTGNWGMLPLVTGFLVGRELEAILPSDRIQIKWPNDLMCRNRKVGGILVETVVQPEPIAVVGVGLNLNMRPDAFPAELQEIAISLYEVLECESSRWFLLGQIIRGFLESYPDILTKAQLVLDWIEERDILLGKELHFLKEQERCSGRGAGISSEGALLIETEAGTVESIISAHQINFGAEFED